MLLQKDLVVHH